MTLALVTISMTYIGNSNIVWSPMVGTAHFTKVTLHLTNGHDTQTEGQRQGQIVCKQNQKGKC